jgi:thymidine kinase
MSKNGSAKTPGLTADQRAELLAWSPPWYSMPVHAEVEYQLQRALDGKENTVIVGTRGVGKSETVRSAIRRVEAKELARVAEVKETEEGENRDAQPILPSYPRGILYYEASKTSGSKTSLRDLLRELKRRVTPSEVRTWTPSDFVERTFQQARRKQVHLVCIDEAQFINPENLELLRQVPDLARTQNFRMGIVLVGDHRLRHNVAATGQLGQRYTGLVEFPRFETLVGEIELWHPHLQVLKKRLNTKEWRLLTRTLALAASGSFRRLTAALENANALAYRLGRPLDDEVLAMAIEKLAPEA